jgi:hypothetical protein
VARTSELLNWVELECHGWTREGIRGTRALLNEAHKLLKMRQSEQNVVYDSATGDLPYLTTTAGIFRYSLGATIWLPQEILVDDPASLDFTLGWITETVKHAGKTYYRLRNIRSAPWSQSANAWVQFTGCDPGTTIAVYRTRCYGKPAEITSDSVQHDMPGDTDVKFLLPATVMLCQALSNHEKFLDARRYIIEVLAPQCWAEENAGEQGVSAFTESRPY